MKSKVLFLALLISMIIHGQEKGTQDIGLSLGGFTTNDFVDDASTIITSVGNATFTNSTTTPSISIYYKYVMEDNWLLYADGTFQSISEDANIDDVKVGDVNNTFLTFGFGTEYHYIKSDWFQMYSGGSIAYTSQTSDYTGSSDDFEDNTDGYFNFQINALGFRFGKTIAATLELGIGYRGVANIGISYQF